MGRARRVAAVLPLCTVLVAEPGTPAPGEEGRVRIYKDALVSCEGEVFQAGAPASPASFRGCGFAATECCGDARLAPGVPTRAAPGGPLEAIVVLTQPQWGAGFYFHFLVSALSRLAWVVEQHPGVVEDGNTSFHTGANQEQYQVWATMLGIRTTRQQDRLLEGWWQAKTVYFPPSNGCAKENQGAEPHALAWMQSKLQGRMRFFSEHLPVQPVAARVPRIALVIRHTAKTTLASPSRAVSNHDEVVAQVRATLPGWQIKVFKDWQLFTDYHVPSNAIYECHLFHCANIILGPHGAGLTNIVCARPAAPVIEFRPRDGTLEYELLAKGLGLPYSSLELDVPADGVAGNVDLSALRDALRWADKQDGSPTLKSASCVASALGQFSDNPDAAGGSGAGAMDGKPSPLPGPEGDASRLLPLMTYALVACGPLACGALLWLVARSSPGFQGRGGAPRFQVLPRVIGAAPLE